MGRIGGKAERSRDMSGQPVVPQNYGDFLMQIRLSPLTTHHTPEQPLVGVTRDAIIGARRPFFFRIQGFLADMNIAPMGDHLQCVHSSPSLLVLR